MMNQLLHSSCNMTATNNYTSYSTTSSSVTNTSSRAGYGHVSLSSSPTRIILVCIYTAVLVVGALGIALMINVLKSNLRSVTTVAVLNIIVAHLLFLPSIPFRIDYYVRNSWDLPSWVCRVVSAMIHIHMYISFIIYVAVLTLRFHGFYKRAERQVFYRKLHSLGASAAIWAVVLIVAPLVLWLKYGEASDDHTCFRFGLRMKDPGVREINYIISAVFLIVPIVLSGIQGHILLTIIRQYGATSSSQQEFWAQVKSLCFVLIMLVCFVPYHIFRMHYLSNTELEDENEIFLAITALSCFDLLIFVWRGACHSCSRANVF